MLYELKRSVYWLFHSPKDFLGNVMCYTVDIWPSEFYLKVLFRLHFGYWPDFRNPKTFSEKINWLKINDIHPEYCQLVDKYEAKRFVASVIGEEYIIPTLGLWNSIDEIDWEKLPEQFVIKSTSDSGSIVICKEKSKFDVEDAKRKLIKLGTRDYYKVSKEYPYKNIPHRFIAEEYIEEDSCNELNDYKFFCFDGVPKFCQVIRNRRTKETIDFYDMNWIHMPFIGLVSKDSHIKFGEAPVPKPRCLEKMLYIASRLSKGKTFSRIDLYLVRGKVYFGEITFFPASGMGSFEPREWDYKLGEMIKLSIDK